MAEQKMVIKVPSMDSDKSRSKALKIVVGVYGVESAALGKEDKKKLEVIGKGVDPVKLTMSLRKKLPKWYRLFICGSMVDVELETVSALEKKEEKKDEAKQPMVWSYGYTPQYVHYIEDPYRCSIW